MVRNSDDSGSLVLCGIGPSGPTLKGMTMEDDFELWTDDLGVSERLAWLAFEQFLAEQSLPEEADCEAEPYNDGLWWEV